MQTHTIRKQSPTRKARTNLLLDIGLFLAFLLLFEPESTGIPIHEWLGIAMAITILIHILLHWDWVKTITRRFFQQMKSKVRINYILNAAIFVSFTAIMLSGLMISHSVLRFFGLQSLDTPFWNMTHRFATDVTIWLIALHIGLHWGWIVNAVKRHMIEPMRGNRKSTVSVSDSE